jgi:hypothetical protein
MVEFTCCRCKRHVAVTGPGFDEIPDPPVCAACRLLPGWASDPLMRARMGTDKAAVAKLTRKQLADWLWDIATLLAILGFAGGTIYFTYLAGWEGFVYAVLSAILGWMIVTWFGHLIPGVDRYFKPPK